MPGDFLDTSALAKHYHAESGSATVRAIWAETSRSLYVSRLAVLEIVSVFAAKVRAGTITAHEFDALRRRFLADISKTKRLTAARLLVSHYQEADSLLTHHGPARRLRTLDSLQIAVALDLKKRGAIDRLVSADKDMLIVAAAEGMQILNPEDPGP